MDLAGNIDVVSPLYQNGSAIEIDQLSPQGTVRWSQVFSSQLFPSFSSDLSPTGVATDLSGNIYVTGNDGGNNTTFVLKYDVNGKFLASALTPYQGPSYSPDFVSGPVFDPSSGHLYAAEGAFLPPDLATYGLLGMEIDPSNLELLNTQTIAAPPPAPGNSIFNSPAGIGVDPAGNVYVGDNQYVSNPNVQVDNVYLLKSAPHLTAQLSSQFFSNYNDLFYMTVGPAGDIFVAGYNFESGVGLLSKVNAPTYTQTSGSVFPGVTADAQGNAYALDSSLGATKYDPKGNLVWYVTAISGGSSSPSFGNAIAVDGQGNVYLTGTSSNGNTIIARINQATAQNSISVSTGDQQIGVVGSSVAVPLTVLVQNASQAPVASVVVTFFVSSAPIGAVGQGVLPMSAVTAPNGLASTVLTLGNIPADYYVAATAAGSTSSATFHACGKLPNANFQQGGGAPWASDPYDNTCSSQTAPGQTRQFVCPSGALPAGTSRVQIHTDGCALSALATVNNFYQTTNPTIPTTDPLQLNATLSSLTVNGYSGAGRINFGAIQVASVGGIHYVRNGSADVGGTNTEQSLTQTASGDVLSGRPVIFHVKHIWPSGRVTDHYISAVGTCGGQYIVSDPAGALTLYNPSNPGIFPFSGIRRFSP